MSNSDCLNTNINIDDINDDQDYVIIINGKQYKRILKLIRNYENNRQKMRERYKQIAKTNKNYVTFTKPMILPYYLKETKS
jgi:hypothetical protein